MSSFKRAFKDIRDTFDRVLDAIDPPHQAYPPPPVPHGSRPGQYGPPVPYGSHPSQADPANQAPPPYAPHDQKQHPYWAPIFAPERPVTVEFDHEQGAGGWGNNELQTYTNSNMNSFFSPNHTLVLRAIINSCATSEQEKYTSARLLSKQRLCRQKGYLTAVLSAPSAPGIWPAFWMLPEEPFSWPKDGEVDIFEAWNGNQENHSCFHWGDYSGDPGQKKKHRVATTHVDGITAPHEYGFAWEQPEWGVEGGRMMFYVDGRPVMKCDKPEGTRRFEGWRILLNIAVGGTVNNGTVPRDGSYQMELFSLLMWDEPPGGWTKFEQDWGCTVEGRTLD